MLDQWRKRWAGGQNYCGRKYEVVAEMYQVEYWRINLFAVMMGFGELRIPTTMLTLGYADFVYLTLL